MTPSSSTYYMNVSHLSDPGLQQKIIAMWEIENAKDSEDFCKLFIGLRKLRILPRNGDDRRQQMQGGLKPYFAIISK